MAPSRAIDLVCSECGAANRAGETACFLCGHRLDTTWSESTTGARDPGASPKSPPLVKSSGAADAFSASRITFGITSLFLLLGLASICAEVWHEQPSLAIVIAAVALTPPLVYTGFVAAESRASGKPMALLEKVGTFVSALVGVALIAISALVAFCMTCVPAGFITLSSGSQSFYIPLAIGGAAGIAVAAYMTYYLLTRKRRIAQKAGKP